MGILAVLAIGIVAGQLASFLYGGYSLGAIGNAIAGLTGALFAGKYVAAIFSISVYAGMFAAGVVGAAVILAVFSAAESMTSSKKNRLF